MVNVVLNARKIDGISIAATTFHRRPAGTCDITLAVINLC